MTTLRSYKRAVQLITCCFTAGSLTAQVPGNARSTRRPPPPLQAPSVMPPAGTFVGSLQTSGPDGQPLKKVELRGTVEWRQEIDPLDWRAKSTFRIRLRAPDTGMVSIRAANLDAPAPATYPIKLLASGVSHSDPALMTADAAFFQHGHATPYIVEGFRDRVTIHSADARGSISGTLLLTLEPDGDRGAPAASTSTTITGSFSASRNPSSLPEPAVSAEMQEGILRRALEGFTMTWTGAINRDGDPDSTRSERAARRFLESRWSAAAEIDSLAASPQAFYVRLRGKRVGRVCVASSSQSGIRCEADVRRRAAIDR